MSDEPTRARRARDDARATAPLPDAPAAAERIGRFEVRGRLGAGAFGDVYLAYDPQLDREVALKVAKPGTLDTPERAARFVREARSAANLRHPHIVPLYETGRDGNRLFIASAFIPGRTLEAVVEEAETNAEPLPPTVCARLGRKLAEALAYAHGRGVVHRDVKTANVIVDEDGEPLLLDFGLAARAAAGDERLTQDGQGLGTPAYMAPEQAEGHGDAASDQYSLGCLLYELATGRTPFAGRPAQQIFLHKTRPVPSPRRFRPGLPRDLEAVILKCLAKDPERRYASCADAAEDLRRFLDGEPVTARRIGPAGRFGRWCRRNPLVASSVSFGVLALAIGAVVALAQADVATREARRANASADDAKAKQRIAEQKTEEATEATGRATKERERANEQEREARLRAAVAIFDRGTVSCEREAVGQGLTDYARALAELPPGNDDMERVIRTSIADWTAQLPRLRGMYQHGTAGGVRLTCLAVTPDGRYLASGSQDGDVRVFDTRSRRPLTGLLSAGPAGPGGVTGVAVRPDGGAVAALVGGEKVRVWSVPGGRLTCEFSAGRGARPVRWAGNDAVEVVCDGAIRRWSADSGLAVGEPVRLDLKAAGPGGATEPPPAWWSGAQYSADGQLVTGVVSGRVAVWESATGRKVLESTAGGFGNAPNNPLAFSRDKSRLFVGFYKPGGSQIEVWDVATGKVVNRIVSAEVASRVAVTALSPTPDGKGVVVGYSDGQLKYCPVTEADSPGGPRPPGTPERTPTANLPVQANNTFPPAEVAVSDPDGRGVFVGNPDGSIRLWDVPPRPPALWAPPDGVAAVAYGGGRLAACGFGGEFRVWDGDREVGRWRTDPGPVSAVALAPDGQVVAVEGFPKVTVFDLTTGRSRQLEISPEVRPLFPLAFSADGRAVATSGAKGAVRFLDRNTGAEIGTLRGTEGLVRGGVFTPDGTRLLTSGNSRYLRTWEWPGLREVGEPLDTAFGSSFMALSADGRRLAVGWRSVVVWDLPRRRPVGPAAVPPAPVRQIGLSADGRTVLGRCDDGAVRVWDVATGRPLATTVATDKVRLLSAALRPDGRAYAVGDEWGVRVVPIPEPVPGTPERVAVWLEVITGYRTLDIGSVERIGPGRWDEVRRRLDALDGPPAP
jgi:WD40 repeat protein